MAEATTPDKAQDFITRFDDFSRSLANVRNEAENLSLVLTFKPCQDDQDDQDDQEVN